MTISLAMLALLACGFAGQIGVDVQYQDTKGLLTLYQQRLISIEDGRFRCFSISSPVKPPGFATTFHVRPTIRFWPPRVPDVRQMFFGFDAHSLIGTKTSTMYLVACPIWFAAIPFLIVPALWLHKRRRRASLAFAVIVGDEKSA